MSDESVITLNLVGFMCPIPVHETRRAFELASSGTTMLILCDDPETLHDIPALCDRLELDLLGVEEEAGEYGFRIRK
ncbi:MAG: sulfurtransferase TusA family protein [Candidatus Thermoplasmatota archaeon]|nr:sulfurtransferase TusA family protein [Candidatus Thermoplasmatota archaeon]